jgi:hypothetical protein
MTSQANGAERPMLNRVAFRGPPDLSQIAILGRILGNSALENQ